MTLKIRIATRKSELALRQVDIVKSYFGEDVEIETIKVTTSGDKISFFELTTPIAVSSQLVSIPSIFISPEPHIKFLSKLKLYYKLNLKLSNAI